MLTLLKLCYLSRMNHTEHRILASQLIAQEAIAHARSFCQDDGDVAATQIGIITGAIDILVRAFEEATDHLMPERRKDLLTGEHE